MGDHAHLGGRHKSVACATTSHRPLPAPIQEMTGTWWWLGIPILLIAGLPIVCWLAPDFFRQRMLPEGFGYLELSHFFVPLAGFVLGLRLLLAKSVRANRLWWVLILLVTLACL